MNVPTNLKYTKDHEWARVEGDVAYIGITDFAQGELGDVVFVDIDPGLKSVEAGKVFGTVEAVKTVSDLYAPVSGEVLEVNEALSADAALLNRDPYGEGWMIKVKISNPAELDSLLTAEQYQELIGQ
ncbi:MAG TPA: glycine cleavage system protein GcvH [Ignavibacteriales bacterium]|nr:glycine cleavage system protein GcvH [Ignavibacteriales bacterium]HOL81727.1 glycine cleavage system protein GcvH [Ignavibacteriales bacterium]HOM65714.1 glycine cleavage system protein GcvH [Ignavibacteriales bacterium]HPD68514.1 glycine cleavage system protein GcvH [Ignavibacteriales bacterium]HPP32935.1 glycine cleavage system protein GcvH [Ignavibacteriales bacterium]